MYKLTYYAQREIGKPKHIVPEDFETTQDAIVWAARNLHIMDNWQEMAGVLVISVQQPNQWRAIIYEEREKRWSMN